MDDNKKRFMTIEECATYLSVNKQSIYRWIKDKKFPAHHVNGCIRVSKSELDKWITSEKEKN